MATANSYATLAEFKAYFSDRKGVVAPGAQDDTVIEMLLRTASRLIDSKTGRNFYPRVDTLHTQEPDADSVTPRQVRVNADLLEAITVTNGDGTVIPSTEYYLTPRDITPHYGIYMRDTSVYGWYQGVSDGILVSGLWGAHRYYSQAWETITTASEDMDASETGLDVVDGTLLQAGNIIRLDNELCYVSSVTGNSPVIIRGVNGSTAATHLSGVAVKLWVVMDDCKEAVLEIANQAYKRRFGQSVSNVETITGAGIVLSPRDIPAMAQEFIGVWKKIT